MQVGQNAYEADVLTAIKTDQREIFYDIVDIKPIKIETSGKAHMESEDSRSRLPEASEQSIAQASGESNANEAAVLKTTLKRLIEQVSSAPLNRHMRLKNFVQFSQFSSRCFGGTIEAESSDIQEEPHGRKEH